MTVNAKPPNPVLDPFDFPSVVRQEGELEVDHTASPGLSETSARRFGYIPELAREGKVFRAAVLACCDCPSVFVKNPERTRERGYCSICDGYLCDACVAARKDPNWTHHSRQELIDKVASGKWDLSGSMSLPVLTRKESTNG